MIQIILVNEESRASQYGIGTYIKQLCLILSQKQGIHLSVICCRSTKNDFYIERKGDIDYYHINLLQNENMSVLPNDIKDYQDLSGFYIFMIEANKKQFKKVFNIFLNHPYDCTLFNCSAGKDRTGVIACMLLDLAGCHEYDIVKDYSESYENNMAMIKQLEEMMPSEDEKFLGSDPRVMMKFIAYLRENYGSTKGYLLNIGFSDEEIEEIKEKFCF